MKTSKEFFENLKKDAAFAKQIQAAIEKKREAGAKTMYEAVIPVAAEAGYEVKTEDIDSLIKQYDGEISEEELGKIAGGFACVIVIMSVMFTISAAVTEIID